MKNSRWLRKSCAPFGRKKEEEEDAPVATRLRSRDNQVDRVASSSRNQTDKHSQNSRHKSNSSQVQSSSSSRTRQPVQLSKDPKSKSHETERNKIFAQPNNKNEANNNINASSSSQVQRNRQKMKNVRFSEKPSEHNRPLEEDPYDIPVVEPYAQYIRSQERQRQAVGYTCKLCERDVGDTPFGEVEEEDSDLYPGTSVFPCGHVYHSSCLRFQFGNQDITEDSCIFCFK
ncbi:hypothetical protein K1719_011399 [Acacia pycnantha]|nr:hypothetical protein K1719_011399 [Acacia pycnantha]